MKNPELPKRRIMKLRDGVMGDVYEFTPEEALNRMDVKHQSLDDNILARIGVIYKEIKSYWPIATLEQFEFQFMKDENPENEVELWERMIKTWNFCCSEMDVSSTENIQWVLDILVYYSAGALSQEESEDPIIRGVLLAFENIDILEKGI